MKRKHSRDHFFRFIREFVLPHKLAVVLLVLNILCRVGLGLWWPWANKTIVDRVLNHASPEVQLAVFIISIGFGILILNHVFHYFFNKLLYSLLVYITQRARTRLADHLLKLPQQFYDASHAGRLLTTAIGDPGAITHSITGGMVNAIANALTVLGGYFILIQMNGWLTLAISGVFPVMVGAYFLLRPKMIANSEKLRESWGILSGMVAEKIGAVRVVRSFAAEEVETAKFRNRVMIHREFNLKSNWYHAFYGFLNGLCIHLGYMVVFLVGGYLYLQGRTTIGTVVAFYGYFQSLFPAILQICNMQQQIASASGSLNKVFNLLDEPLVIEDRPDAKDLTEPLREIVFENVSFRYGPHLPWGLRNINVEIKAGEKVGIIGPSGAGKSTMMALLLRFYDPTEGRILINGRDARDWTLQSLRRAFGHVPQDVILFSGSIRENIFYTHHDVDDDALWEALKHAEASDFVRNLPRGLDSRVGERGLSLSGGQKQRLSIARAMLSRPQMLILDNCTSALDAETEKRLQNTLKELLRNRTAIIVSHRISSISDSSRVLVLDAGRIIEQGSPAELMELQGYFTSIFHQQTTMAA